MAKFDFMIYGAYGYTGKLLVEEALKKGKRPLLAGRSEEKLREVASATGLEYTVADLRNHDQLSEAVSSVKAVIHAAGPFIYTASPMQKACLEAGVHYLDVTGEIPVFEHTLSNDKKAREKGVALISGVGFDVVPTDSLALHVSNLVSDPVDLEIAFGGLGGLSPGTVKTFLRGIHAGTLVRRRGKLVRIKKGKRHHVLFHDRERPVMPISWGDLATAYHSTGIPNITVYTALSRRSFLFNPSALKVVSLAMRFSPVRKKIHNWVDRFVQGPDKRTRESSFAFVWARAANQKGQSAEGWLKLAEGYRFTALSSLAFISKVLRGDIAGAFTPSRAFGSDFVLEIEGTERFTRAG